VPREVRKDHIRKGNSPNQTYRKRKTLPYLNFGGVLKICRSNPINNKLPAAINRSVQEGLHVFFASDFTIRHQQSFKRYTNMVTSNLPSAQRGKNQIDQCTFQP
jgi:hypothetical protein